MKEFMMAALPWICIGFAIALFAANHGAVKKAKDSGKEYGNYMTEGMCLGMCGCVMVVLSGLAVAFDNGEEKVKVHINTKRYR